ncbi:hypothetical protein BSKO_13904 [Bryopsis sp. KO-2023]|nr:hypothetical protein BSKO_13904 [Bryopsis sp. KO-2023]
MNMKGAIIAVSLCQLIVAVAARPVAVNFDLTRGTSRSNVPVPFARIGNPSITVEGGATNHRGCGSYYCIFIQNDCKDEISVAARYIPVNSDFKALATGQGDR